MAAEAGMARYSGYWGVGVDLWNEGDDFVARDKEGSWFLGRQWIDSLTSPRKGRVFLHDLKRTISAPESLSGSKERKPADLDPRRITYVRYWGADKGAVVMKERDVLPTSTLKVEAQKMKELVQAFLTVRGPEEFKEKSVVKLSKEEARGCFKRVLGRSVVDEEDEARDLSSRWSTARAGMS